jgi:hypothetical protein
VPTRIIPGISRIVARLGPVFLCRIFSRIISELLWKPIILWWAIFFWWAVFLWWLFLRRVFLWWLFLGRRRKQLIRRIGRYQLRTSSSPSPLKKYSMIFLEKEIYLNPYFLTVYLFFFL